MYVDKDGKEYKHIHLLQNCENFLDGWYFEDECNCFDGNGPYETAEKAIEELDYYFNYYLIGGLNV